VKEMIRDEVIFWGATILLVIFAFVLMPAHERFKDAQGRETDVSPDAPPKPEGLKPINERTGQREGFWGSITSFFSPSREKMTGGTPTLKDYSDAMRTFLMTLANNETDPALKSSLVSARAEIPTNNMTMALSPEMMPTYKLFTSQYTSLQQIATASNLPKPTATAREYSPRCHKNIVSRFTEHCEQFGCDTPLSGVTAQQSSTPPQFNTDSTLGATDGNNRNGEDIDTGRSSGGSSALHPDSDW